MICEHQEAAEEGVEAACRCQQQAWKPELLSNRQPERFSYELDDKDEEEAVNTTTPDKCPKCGASLRSLSLRDYQCDGRYEEDNDGWFFNQSYHCLATQRDQLANKVRMLEARLANRDEASACAVIQDGRRGES